MITALTLARDEVFWLFKHNNMTPPKSKHRPNPDDYSDPALPELLFNIAQLKSTYLFYVLAGLQTEIDLYMVYCVSRTYVYIIAYLMGFFYVAVHS